MAIKTFPVSRVYGLLAPAPLLSAATARKGRANVMDMVMAMS